MKNARILVIGAGLAGLGAALRLLEQGQDVLVLESSARAGGQIHTHSEPGLVVELGAEGFIARSKAVPALCGRLGLEGSLVEQLTTDTYVIQGQELVLLPAGEAARRLGFQVPEDELGRGIRSLAGGMGELTGALLEHIGRDRVRLAAPLAAVSARQSGLALELSDGTREHADALVLATPARVAAQLLAPLALNGAPALASAPTTSNVSVNLLYRLEQLGRVPAGSGLLFPEELAGVGLRALSFASHKFSARAPAGSVLLRLFFRPVAGSLEAWDDARFIAEATQAVDSVLGAVGEPDGSWVSRWVELLPVFTPAYRAQVAELDTALQARGIHLAGSAFHGAGIDAAVASAEVVAARLAG